MIERYRYRCPNCRSASLSPTPEGEGDYRCRKCSTPIDRNEREDTKLPPAPARQSDTDDWEVSVAELIGIVRSRRD